MKRWRLCSKHQLSSLDSFILFRKLDFQYTIRINKIYLNDLQEFHQTKFVFGGINAGLTSIETANLHWWPFFASQSDKLFCLSSVQIVNKNVEIWAVQLSRKIMAFISMSYAHTINKTGFFLVWVLFSSKKCQFNSLFS